MYLLTSGSAGNFCFFLLAEMVKSATKINNPPIGLLSVRKWVAYSTAGWKKTKGADNFIRAISRPTKDVLYQLSGPCFLLMPPCSLGQAGK